MPKPPGLDSTPLSCNTHINLQLINSHSPTGRNLLNHLCWSLKQTNAKLADAREIFNCNDTVTWLIEQLQKKPKPMRNDSRYLAADKNL
jgi:hypothetical protein